MTGRAPVDVGGTPGTRSLLPDAARLPAVAVVAVCAVTTALLGASLGHGAHTDAVDAAVDARLRTSVAGQLKTLEELARLGDQSAIVVMTAVLVLACLLRRRYRGAALAAISVPVASVITERLLKPLVGRTSLGFLSFPSGHATGTFALATVITVLLVGAGAPRAVRVAAAVIAFVLAAAVAAAMIALGWHYFTDAVAGAAVGIGAVLATALVLDLLMLVWRSREPPLAGSREEQLKRADVEAAPQHESDAH
jgi:membrane-associated phospholipid phosphatase